MIGQGKLCCRLLTDVYGITSKRSKAEEEIDEYKGQINIDCSLNEGKSFLNYDIMYPSISESPRCSKSLTFGEKLQRLQEMFPGRSVMDIRENLRKHDSLDAAAIELSSNEPVTDNDLEILPEINFDQKIDDQKHCNLQEILENMKSKFSNEKEKSKADEDDLFNDALSYYNDCDFDPKKPLRIQYSGQPAADTGEVLRQFFTDLLTETANSYFHGSYYKITFI